MKALVYGKDVPHSVDCSIAFHGFEELEYDITLSNKWLELTKNDFEQFDVCVGGVDMCRYALSKMQVRNYDSSCYPQQLKSFLFRNIEEIRICDLYKVKSKKFIKPIRPKRFVGFTTDNEDLLVSLMNLDEEEKIYVSDCVNFLSEWRVYVNNNEIKAICNYNGNPTMFPDVNKVKKRIADFEGPCCYVLDVGTLAE